MDTEKLKKLCKKINLVVADMDGTLLNSKKEITYRTIEAIKKLREKGINFTICTGRIPTMAEYYLRKLEIDVPIISANGAIIWDYKQKMPLYEKRINPVQAEILLNFCRDCNMDYSILTLNTSYFSENSERIRRFHDYNKIALKNGGQKMKLEYLKQDHTFLREINIYKILIYELEPGQQKQAQEFIDNLSEIGYTSSDERLLDISALGINKGTGLLEEAKILNLKKENICTFGDFYNDIPFLNASGFPIAMGNSCSELKEIAYYVTKINDEDGVADAIEKFLI